MYVRWRECARECAAGTSSVYSTSEDLDTARHQNPLHNYTLISPHITSQDKAEIYLPDSICPINLWVGSNHSNPTCRLGVTITGVNDEEASMIGLVVDFGY